MDSWLLRKTRWRRWARLWLADVWAESTAPLVDANARLNYIVVAVLVFLLLPQRSHERAVGQVISVLEAVEAALYAIPAFLLLNGIFGAFRVARAERAMGTWFGPKYVYHDPMHIATLLIEPADQVKSHLLSIPNVEDDSLVAYRVEIDRRDERVKAQIEFPNCPPTFGWQMVSKSTRTTSRLPRSRTMSLITRIEPESSATTVRVFALSFEVGEGS